VGDGLADDGFGLGHFVLILGRGPETVKGMQVMECQEAIRAYPAGHGAARAASAFWLRHARKWR
jgi:hypothetical protein